MAKDFGNISGANANSDEYLVHGNAVHVHVDDSGAGSRTTGAWDSSTATLQLKCKDSEWVNVVGSAETDDFDNVIELFEGARVRIAWTGSAGSVIELYWQFHSVRL